MQADQQTRTRTADALLPVEEGLRVRALDGLRGLALLGILIANVRQMLLPWDIANLPVTLGTSDWLAWLDWQFFHAFVDLKFLTIFSLLFGVGFALQAQRLEKSGRDFGALYLRRVLLLALLGIAHGLLLYPAEVLMPYALAALLLLLVRRISTAMLTRAGLALLGFSVVWGYQIGALSHVDLKVTLAAVALFVVFVPISRKTAWGVTLALWTVLVVGLGALLTLLHTPGNPETSAGAELVEARELLLAIVSGDAAGWPDEYRIRQEGGLAALLALHASEYLLLLVYVGVLLLWRTLAIFMIGAGAFRAGLFSSVAAPLWRRSALIGLGVGVPLSLLATALHTREVQGLVDWRFPQYLHEVTALLMAVGIAGVVFLRFAAAPASSAIWDRIEAAGRMALTNYIAQSLVIVALAENWGFGLYGHLGGPVLTAIAFSVFAALAVASHFWLKRYRMGPLEWFWRCGTYGTWLPNKRPLSLPLR